MSGWSLRWKEKGVIGPRALIDGSRLRPDTLSKLTLAEVAGVELEIGKRSVPLGDLFDIAPLLESGPSPRLSVDGSPRFIALGASMEEGILEVKDQAGDLLGAGMRGGAIRVAGDAGRLAGAGMTGGLIRIAGSAGPWVGGPLPGATTGMRGGEIIVLGNAGDEPSWLQRQGLIAIGGSAGGFPGRDMLAGTLLVACGDLDQPGIGMGRGTILGLESRSRPPLGFRRDGPVFHGWLRLLLRRLEEVGFSPPNDRRGLFTGERPLDSWSGDRLSAGRGEILVPAS